MYCMYMSYQDPQEDRTLSDEAFTCINIDLYISLSTCTEQKLERRIPLN